MFQFEQKLTQNLDARMNVGYPLSLFLERYEMQNIFSNVAISRECIPWEWMFP